MERASKGGVMGRWWTGPGGDDVGKMVERAGGGGAAVMERWWKGQGVGEGMGRWWRGQEGGGRGRAVMGRWWRWQVGFKGEVVERAALCGQDWPSCADLAVHVLHSDDDVTQCTSSSLSCQGIMVL